MNLPNLADARTHLLKIMTPELQAIQTLQPKHHELAIHRSSHKHKTDWSVHSSLQFRSRASQVVRTRCRRQGEGPCSGELEEQYLDEGHRPRASCPPRWSRAGFPWLQTLSQRVALVCRTSGRFGGTTRFGGGICVKGDNGLLIVRKRRGDRKRMVVVVVVVVDRQVVSYLLSLSGYLVSGHQVGTSKHEVSTGVDSGEREDERLERPDWRRLETLDNTSLHAKEI